MRSRERRLERGESREGKYSRNVALARGLRPLHVFRGNQRTFSFLTVATMRLACLWSPDHHALRTHGQNAEIDCVARSQPASEPLAATSSTRVFLVNRRRARLTWPHAARMCACITPCGLMAKMRRSISSSYSISKTHLNRAQKNAAPALTGRSGILFFVALANYFFNSASMALVTSGASGFTRGSKRETILPSLLIRNLVKFHWISPACCGSVSFEVRNW